MINWQEFSTPTPSKVMTFRKELFSEVFNAMWKRYEETKDSQMVVVPLMLIMNDFPDVKTMFDIYYMSCEGNDPWSDKKIVFRFFRMLSIVYENLELELENV